MGQLMWKCVRFGWRTVTKSHVHTFVSCRPTEELTCWDTQLRELHVHSLARSFLSHPLLSEGLFPVIAALRKHTTKLLIKAPDSTFPREFTSAMRESWQSYKTSWWALRSVLLTSDRVCVCGWGRRKPSRLWRTWSCCWWTHPGSPGTGPGTTAAAPLRRTSRSSEPERIRVCERSGAAQASLSFPSPPTATLGVGGGSLQRWKWRIEGGGGLCVCLCGRVRVCRNHLWFSTEARKGHLQVDGDATWVEFSPPCIPGWPLFRIVRHL